MRIQLRALVPMRRIAAAVMALASGLVIVSAQSSDTFVPVTDAMLEAPAAGDWLTWRRTPDGWGYSPLDQIDRDNVHQLRMVWSRGLAPGRRSERRHQPEHRHLRPLHHQHQRRRVRLRTRRRDGRDRVGTQIFDCTEISALHSSGPIIADGKVISGRSCGRPEACVIVAHDARTGEELWRRRTIPAPGEPGDETWGGVPFEERRHVGTWMPPSYDHELPRAAPGLPGHIGDGAGPEVHARRRRQSAHLPQLDPGPRSAPSTTRPARSSGRSTSARRSPASRSATRSTAGSTSRSAPVIRERRGPSPRWPRSLRPSRGNNLFVFALP